MESGGNPTLDPAILAYYDRRPEETRLERGLSQLEAVRTRALIERFVPPAPAVALDVGGAAGAYAAWLAGAGYETHLIEPVPRLVEEARRRNGALVRPIATCQVGDARALPWPSGSADVVLLLGPLYHLTEAADRAQALAEAARVLRPAGVLFAAAISRWASLLDGLVHDFAAAADYRQAAERAVRDGQHRNEPQRDGLFTTAYFHEPEELRAEVAAMGLDVVGLFGIEGPARMLADFEERWADPRRRAEMVRVAEAVESEPSLLGLSGHILAIAQKAAEPPTPAG